MLSYSDAETGPLIFGKAGADKFGSARAVNFW